MINSSNFHSNIRENVFNNEIREKLFLESDEMNDSLVIYAGNDTFWKYNNVWRTIINVLRNILYI